MAEQFADRFQYQRFAVGRAPDEQSHDETSVACSVALSTLFAEVCGPCRCLVRQLGNPEPRYGMLGKKPRHPPTESQHLIKPRLTPDETMDSVIPLAFPARQI
jgi:hypothetical protein